MKITGNFFFKWLNSENTYVINCNIYCTEPRLTGGKRGNFPGAAYLMVFDKDVYHLYINHLYNNEMLKYKYT